MPSFEDLNLGDYVPNLIGIESGGNRFAKTGSNYGLGQFSRDQFGTFGISDWTNPDQQIRAIQQEAIQNHPALSEALGRDPTGAEHYVAHQQGLVGAKALFNNPDVPAWQVVRPFYKSDYMAKLAITGNIPDGNPLKRLPVEQIPSSAFTGMWIDRFNRTSKSPVPEERASGSPGGIPLTPEEEAQATAAAPSMAPFERARSLADLQATRQALAAPAGTGTGFSLGGGLNFNVPRPPPAPPVIPLSSGPASIIPASRLLATYGMRR